MRGEEWLRTNSAFGHVMSCAVLGWLHVYVHQCVYVSAVWMCVCVCILI